MSGHSFVWPQHQRLERPRQRLSQDSGQNRINRSQVSSRAMGTDHRKCDWRVSWRLHELIWAPQMFDHDVFAYNYWQFCIALLQYLHPCVTG